MPILLTLPHLTGLLSCVSAEAVWGLSSTRLQTKVNEMLADGLMPISITGVYDGQELLTGGHTLRYSAALIRLLQLTRMAVGCHSSTAL